MQPFLLEINGNIGQACLHAKLASHTINHRNSPSLHGRATCHAVATSTVKFTLNERMQILYWIEAEQEIILEHKSPELDRRAAWRQAVVRLLI